MDAKRLAIILIIISVLLAGTLVYLRGDLIKAYDEQIKFYENTGKSCPTDPNICPHALKERSMFPIYIGFVIAVGILSLAVYLLYFEKSEKAILESLTESKKQRSSDEKFDLILSALDEDEKKVLKAVREQDGITQATLRIRTDISKTKLSLVIKNLEDKKLIKRIEKGKTFQVYLKKAF